MRKVHIFELSKLVYAGVAQWDRIRKGLNKDRRHLFWSYKPLREAIVSMISDPGRRDEIVEEMVRATSEKSPLCTHHSLQALDVFEQRFLPKIASLNADLMCGRKDTELPAFCGLRLAGGPHMEVTDCDGKRRFLYIHPSKDWTDQEIDAFCELLVVVLEETYSGGFDELWFLDLHRGQLLARPKSKKRVRQRCVQAAEVLRDLLETRANRSSAA